MKRQLNNVLKELTPPVAYRLYNILRGKEAFVGNYRSWAEACKFSNGYDSQLIIEKIKEASLQVKLGKAVYERDSILFDSVHYAWPLLAALMFVAANNGGVLNIIDFGGSLGTTYYQNRRFLDRLGKVRWNIVEQELIVKYGKELFEDDRLKFYRNIIDCIQERKPSALLLSSVLMYLEEPYRFLEDICRYDFMFLIVDRTIFNTCGRDRLTVQKTSIYNSSYPCWFLNIEKFKKIIEAKYDLIEDFLGFENKEFEDHFYKGFIYAIRSAR